MNGMYHRDPALLFGPFMLDTACETKGMYRLTASAALLNLETVKTNYSCGPLSATLHHGASCQ